MSLPIRFSPPASRAVCAIIGALSLMGGGEADAAAADKTGRRGLNLEARPIEETLRQIQQQTGLLIWCPRCHGAGKQIVTNAVRGEPDIDRALAAVFDDTGASYSRYGRFVLVLITARERRAASPPQDPFPQESKLPEVFVVSKRTLNSDIERTINDATPYDVYDAEQIERSGYATVGDFLRNFLNAHVPAPVAGSSELTSGISSQLNLRGMGTSQTVILVDGQRQAGVFLGGTVQQPDIDAIPAASVARIEVLKSTASAHAGAGAVAGVVNIVLRHEEQATAFRVQATRLASAPSSAGQFWVEKGLTSKSGDAWLSWSGGILAEEDAQEKDAGTLVRGRAELAARNPAFIAANPEPPLGAGINFHALGANRTYGCVLPGWNGNADSLQVVPGQYCTGLGDSAQDLGGASATRIPSRRIITSSIAARSALNSILSAHFELRYSDSRRRGSFSALDNLDGRSVALGPASSFELAPEGVLARTASRLGDGIMTSTQSSRYGTVAVQARFSGQRFIQASQTLSSVTSGISQPWLSSEVTDLSDLAALAALQRAEPSVTLVASPRFKSSLENSNLLFTTSLWDVGAGLWQVTLSADYRHERLADASFVPSETEVSSRLDQTVTSYQGELSVPLLRPRVGSKDPAMALELAVRDDSVRIGAPVGEAGSGARFAASTYIASAIVRPIDGLSLRGGCGTGFQAPPLSMLRESVDRFYPELQVRDPLRNEFLTAVTAVTGGSTDLKAERARTCTSGLVVKALDETLSLSLDYVRILKKDVVVPPEQLFFGSDPSRYIALNPGRIVRQPTSDGTPGKIERIDTFAINIERQDVRAFDLSLGWKQQLGRLGRLDMLTSVTAQPVFRRRTALTVEAENDAGIIALTAPRYRALTSMALTQGPWSLGWITRHTSSSRLPDDGVAHILQADDRIPSQTYHDLFLGYSTSALTGDPSGWSIRLDVRNVLNGQAPFDASERYLANRYGESERRSLALTFQYRF